MIKFNTVEEFTHWYDLARRYRVELISLRKTYLTIEAPLVMTGKVRISAANRDCCPSCKLLHGKLYEFEDALVWDYLPNLSCERFKNGLYCCASWTQHFTTDD